MTQEYRDEASVTNQLVIMVNVEQRCRCRNISDSLVVVDRDSGPASMEIPQDIYTLDIYTGYLH